MRRSWPCSGTGTISTWIGERSPYFRALSSRAHRTWSSWSTSATASQPAERSSTVNGTPSAASASHARRTRMGEGDDLAAGLEGAGLEAGHGQELADHPRQPVGLLGDDPEPAIRPVADELLGVRPDAGQRRLEVVADAAEEVVLGGVELEELAVLGLDLGEQLAIPDRHRDLAREQLEEVLVGALPQARRRQVTDEDAELLPAEPEDGADRQGLPGDPLLRRRSASDRRAGRRRRSSRTRPGRRGRRGRR